MLSCTSRSPCQKRFYRLDSTRSAGPSRLIPPGGDRYSGGDPIDEKVGDDSLFWAQRSQDQRQPGWQSSLDLDSSFGKEASSEAT